MPRARLLILSGSWSSIPEAQVLANKAGNGHSAPTVISMSPRKGKKGPGRRATPSGLRPDAESDVLTLQEVAEYLDCSYATVLLLVMRYGLLVFRLGGAGDEAARPKAR